MYYITSFCHGNKYSPIIPKWKERIANTCPNSEIIISNDFPIELKYGYTYAWWDVMRTCKNICLLHNYRKPVVHIDIDLIIEKDIEPLVNLDYDFIISTEIGGNEAFPKECSKILGFGVCSGFYILKPSALSFIKSIFDKMTNYTYNTYSDQVSIMNHIISNKHIIYDEVIELHGISYTNKIIEIDGIKICVLNFDIITRDPIVNNNQFGNHINIDNVGGTANFLKYFDEDLEKLPLTCRCGKTHLGDNNICKHKTLRKTT